MALDRRGHVDMVLAKADRRDAMSKAERERWYKVHPDDRFFDQVCAWAHHYGGQDENPVRVFRRGERP